MTPRNKAAPPLADPLLPATATIQTYTGYGRSAAEKLIKTGEIPAVQIGGRNMVRLSAVLAFLAAAEARTAAKRRAA